MKFLSTLYDKLPVVSKTNEIADGIDDDDIQFIITSLALCQMC